MKRMLSTIGLSALLCASIVAAQAAGGTGSTGTKAPAKAKSVSGSVSTVGTDNVVVKVTQAKKTVEDTIYTDSATVLKKGTAVIMLADLKAGASVKVTYRLDGAKMVADTIAAKAEKAAASGGAKKSTGAAAGTGAAASTGAAQ